MKVALIHDWLIHMRGGEKVLQGLAELYPDATIYTLFYSSKKLSPELQKMKVKTSFLQYLPGIRYYYRWLLPILPWVIETMEVKEADVVISSSHCVAKGIRIPENAKHICYCHTPMRYIWGFEDIYFKNTPFFLRPFLNMILDYLRKWDAKSAIGVDCFVANSKNVAARINKFYQKEADVIYPPVDLSDYYPEGEPEDYYLVVSAFVPYKKVDLVIEAFNGLDKKLLIVGAGPLESDYQKVRKNMKISFLGSISNQDLRQIYSKASALIFPTNEDFGIVPLEAQACATPVIAFGQGGALESVQDGVFFDEQTPEALREAVLAFEKTSIDRASLPDKVKGFSKASFKEKMADLVLKISGAPV